MKKKLLTLFIATTPFFAIPLISSSCNPDGGKNNSGNNNNQENNKSELEQRFDNALFDLNRVLTQIRKAYETKDNKKEKVYQTYNELLSKLDSEQKTKVEQAVKKYENYALIHDKIRTKTQAWTQLVETQEILVKNTKKNKDKVSKIKLFLEEAVDELAKLSKEEIFKDSADKLNKGVEEIRNKIRDLNNTTTNFYNFFLSVRVQLSVYNSELYNIELAKKGELQTFFSNNKSFVTDELINSVNSLIEFQNRLSLKSIISFYKDFFKTSKDKADDFKEALMEEWDSKIREAIFYNRDILVEYLLDNK